MIAYSHIFNLLAKALSFVIGCLVGGGLIVCLNLTPIGPDKIGNHGQRPPAEMLYYLIFIGGAVLASRRFLYFPYLMPGGNWLFLFVERKTKIPWADCKHLSPLFVGGKNFRWFPVKELPTIPENQRLSYLYELAEKSGCLGSEKKG